MALLFSAVTLTAGNQQAEFLVSGIPTTFEDLEGWTAFHDLLDQTDHEQEISVHAETYLYGEGETFKASLEEIAYLTMRAEQTPDFLSGHCDCIADSDFSFYWMPDEEMEEPTL